MNYELANKLKEAGFPQKFGSGTAVWKNGITFYPSDSNDYDSTAKPGWISEDRATAQDDVIVFPTLSELIAACQPGFLYLLHRSDDQWEALHSSRKFQSHLAAWVLTDADYLHNKRALGQTPEVAVANLYLALNNKENAQEN